MTIRLGFLLLCAATGGLYGVAVASYSGADGYTPISIVAAIASAVAGFAARDAWDEVSALGDAPSARCNCVRLYSPVPSPSGAPISVIHAPDCPASPLYERAVAA